MLSDREKWKASPVSRKERVHTMIFQSSKEASFLIAQEIAQLIQEKASRSEKAVLGLATGSSPLGVYKELVRLHKQEGVSFKDVITFNLDEYYPMEPTALQSYVRFMNENLFDEIDIPKENVHIPDGLVDRDKVGEFCEAYEKMIHDAGGLDLQILGIGRTGHIGESE